MRKAPCSATRDVPPYDLARDGSPHDRRRAVTLMEVIFSMGVVLIGLLGLVAILPLAGRRAQESVSLSVGTAVGEQMINELEARKYLADGRLRPVPITTSATVTNLTHTTASPVASFCLDPLFASSTTVPGSVIANRYTGSRFPYYKALDRPMIDPLRKPHNPLADPSTDPTFNPWPNDLPLMQRVGITRRNSPMIFLSASEALEVAEACDDLLVTQPDDQTLNASMNNGELEAVSGGLEYGKRIPRGDFTWFATVNPLPDGQYASLSIVVLRKRIRNFATPTATSPPANAQGNGVGERLAYVTFASGFTGGAGGLVHLVSSDNTVASLRSEDWVMLSRFVRTDFTNPAIDETTGNFYHRWYRVVGVNGEADEFTTKGTAGTDDTNLGARFPNGPHNVWRHKVQLDGPDWSFNFEDTSTTPVTPRAYADNSFENNTFATIVSDVVSVTERLVLLSDL